MKYSIVVSISTDTLFGPLLYKGRLDNIIPMVSEMGFNGIEIGGVRNLNDIDLKMLEKLLNKYNVKIVTIGTAQPYFDEGLAFSSTSREIRKKAVEKVKKILDVSKYLGCSIMMSIIFGKVEYFTDRDDFNRKVIIAKKNICECLQECMSYSERDSTKFLIEPLNRYETNIFNTLMDVKLYLEENKSKLDLSRISLIADTFHMNIEESVIHKSVEECLDIIGHIHFSDSNRCAPGFGHIDFSSIINVLKMKNYSDFISFEILPIPDSETAAKKGKSFITTLWNSISI
ncbi:MAG: sugar phosphate isomerase/epimerase [Actinobacteria bacterium]|nr:sugar phosphate isomerase/epimerase [Actinomycetota bacterium]